MQTGCSATEPQCHGVILMYELWNEPSGENGAVSNMIEITMDEYNTIRSLDPGAAICSPAFTGAAITGSYMANYFAAGGPTGVDCVDFHINSAAPEGQIATINTFNSVRSMIGLQNKPVYATEGGRWGGCSPPNPLPSDEVQEAYIGRIEPIYWSMNVQRHYWYAWDTCAPLWDISGGALKPSGAAYQAIETWMGGAVMNIPCSANGTVWTCGYTRSGGYQALEVWNASGTSNFATPSWAIDYLSLDGKKTTITPGQSVIIGALPILFESARPTPPTNLKIIVH